jgi:phosphoacetylglucosamine mutase
MSSSWETTYAAETTRHGRPAGANGSAPPWFSYGTAGFRTEATLLRSTCFRAGAFAAARAIAHGGKTTGTVVTASHNPGRDNGVKLVEPDGGTLPMALERAAEMLANAGDDDAVAQIEALREAAKRVEEEEEPPPPPTTTTEEAKTPRVLVARDTRESGRALADETLAGVRAMGVEAVDCGIATTPQLHYYVLATNSGAPDSEHDYYARLAAGYAALTEEEEEEEDEEVENIERAPGSRVDASPPLVIDCADGVGAQKLKLLGDAVEPYGLTFDLRNRGDAADSSLNDGCGSDYVQKMKAPPKRGDFGSLKSGTRCVSVDGDADRLIYFETREDGDVDLFDGDQIAVLIATHLNELVESAAPFLTDVTVGVVQTAYANGASTRHLVETLGSAPVCVPTGVKHLHHAAEQLDIGVYFESNGHGTALFSETTKKKIEDATIEALVQRSMPHVKALLALAHCQRCINPAVGDAMSGILLVEGILRRLKTTKLPRPYADLPSRQTKIVVPDRTKIKTEDAERRVREPKSLQDAIDEALRARAATDASVRAFVRPSGTEDCVRLYVEGEQVESVDVLTARIRDACETVLSE